MMNKHPHEIVVAVVILVIVLFVVGMVLSVDEEPSIILYPHEKSETQRTWANDGIIVTARHDGHMFVVFAGNGGGICHHPDCPKCRK